MPFISCPPFTSNNNWLEHFSHLCKLLKEGRYKQAWEFGIPKGRYICDDGREELYDVDYNPWLQFANGKITLADRTEWVTRKRQEPFFYVPYRLWPYYNYEEMKKMRTILLQWERSDTWYRRMDRLNAKIAKHQREKRRNRTHPAKKSSDARQHHDND